MSMTSSWGWSSTRPEAAPLCPAAEAGGEKIRLLRYGDRIARGDYRLHSRFTRAVNFVHERHLLSLVDESVGAGPLNMVVRDPLAVDGELVRVRDDSIQVGPDTFALDHVCRYDSAIEVPPEFATESLERGLALLEETLRRISPPESLIFLLGEMPTHQPPAGFGSALAERFREGCRLLKEGRHADGAGRIKGIGWGLTPSGDDFLCGVLIAWNLRSSLFGLSDADATDQVYRRAENGNPFSMAFLRCAKEGRVFERMKHVIDAVLHADKDAIVSNARRLMSVGETSGADMAAGLIFALGNREHCTRALA